MGYRGGDAGDGGDGKQQMGRAANSKLLPSRTFPASVQLLVKASNIKVYFLSSVCSALSPAVVCSISVEADHLLHPSY